MNEYEEDRINSNNNLEEDQDRILDWEEGLPTAADDLIPLSQLLIPPDLATAFNVSAQSSRTAIEVNRASRLTLSNLRKPNLLASINRSLPYDDPTVIDSEEGEVEEEAVIVKRARRVVWNPLLHKRFVEVVAHLGVEKAVPKAIMCLMNVEGLTRENVASHLQKYRLFLKKRISIDHHDFDQRMPPLMAPPVFGMAAAYGLQ
ncbi:hypothetical protein Sjap_013534 [Stephania japonica]|uniref:HTH myb-type domain-containing protein n=1 Tax=Stephania japonica TaxID=461633 RepID=A0AAP0J025_9MAGN